MARVSQIATTSEEIDGIHREYEKAIASLCDWREIVVPCFNNGARSLAKLSIEMRSKVPFLAFLKLCVEQAHRWNSLQEQLDTLRGGNYEGD